MYSYSAILGLVIIKSMKGMNNMQKHLQVVKKMLDRLEIKNDRTVFKLEYLQSKDNITESLSDFIYTTDELSHDTAYEMTHLALDILHESYSYNDTEDSVVDAITEYADSYTPIYYHDIGEWLKNNVSLVDEIKEEFGSSGNTYKDTQVAYCVTLERIANQLHELVSEIVEAK